LGRVVKGARFREERYALEVPEIAPPPAEHSETGDLASPDGYDYGFGGAPEALIPDLPLGSAPQPAVDVEAVRAEAQAMLDEASRSVDQLLNEAHDRARALVEDAAARADAIAQDARKRGHEEGFHAGREAADRDMNDMLATMRGLLEMANVERHKLMLEAEPELVKLALGIAERVLHQQVALDRGVVVEMAKVAIARLIERDTVTVRVHPADLERMREHRDELIAIGDIRNLRVVEDQRVDRGGVVVDTDAGTIDARISTQLEEARKILHVEEEIVVEPAPNETITKSELTTARAS
jgi:flagellar assembly protein FliH